MSADLTRPSLRDLGLRRVATDPKGAASAIILADRDGSYRLLGRRVRLSTHLQVEGAPKTSAPSKRAKARGWGVREIDGLTFNINLLSLVEDMHRGATWCASTSRLADVTDPKLVTRYGLAYVDKRLVAMVAPLWTGDAP